MRFADELQGWSRTHNRFGALTSILLDRCATIIEHGAFTHLLGGPGGGGSIKVYFDIGCHFCSSIWWGKVNIFHTDIYGRIGDVNRIIKMAHRTMLSAVVGCFHIFVVFISWSQRS
jgi:hypothetical protein